MASKGKAFYDRQIELLAARDVDGIAAHYHEDGRLLGFDVDVRGRDAIRRHFEGYLGYLGFIELLSTDKWAESDDSIFFEATVRTALGVARVYDAFVLEDGKARHHFTGVLSISPPESEGEGA